jgi:hypothetical protein
VSGAHAPWVRVLVASARWPSRGTGRPRDSLPRRRGSAEHRAGNDDILSRRALIFLGFFRVQYVDIVGVPGSIPAAPTILRPVKSSKTWMAATSAAIRTLVSHDSKLPSARPSFAVWPWLGGLV